MPRTKEYVREDVLEAATRVFWERGYEGTSVENLVEATGLHRRSMYGEFGDKDGLFLACIDHYVSKTAKHLMAILQAQRYGFFWLFGLRRLFGFSIYLGIYPCNGFFLGE